MKMRIVGMNSNEMFFQVFNRGDWKQFVMSGDDFLAFMRLNYESVFNELGDDLEKYYYYKCTHDMIRKGESYIFES